MAKINIKSSTSQQTYHLPSSIEPLSSVFKTVNHLVLVKSRRYSRQVQDKALAKLKVNQHNKTMLSPSQDKALAKLKANQHNKTMLSPSSRSIKHNKTMLSPSPRQSSRQAQGQSSSRLELPRVTDRRCHRRRSRLKLQDTASDFHVTVHHASRTRLEL